MFIFESIAQARHSLGGHKLRTGLTMFGIIWGITSMIILVGMGRSSQELFYKEFQKIGERLIFVWAGTSSSGLSGIKGGRPVRFRMEDVRAVRAHCPDVERITPLVRIGYQEVKYGSEILSVDTFGIDEHCDTIRNMVVAEGRFLIRDDVELGSRLCVLGANVKSKLFGNQDAVGESIRVGGVRFRVVGVLARKGDQLSRPFTLDDDQISMPYTTAQRLYSGSKYFYMLALRPVSLGNEQQAREQVVQTLAMRHGFEPDDTDALEVFGTSDMIARVRGTAVGMQFFFGAASIITLLIGGIGVMNIMFVSINERIREIGIMKAVGAKKKHIFLQFLAESIFVTFVAGFIGIVLGGSICLATGAIELPRLVAAPEIDPLVMIISFLTMTVVGVLSGILPALRASRMQIVEALRSY
jgi:putative ABC transport system permease protein